MADTRHLGSQESKTDNARPADVHQLRVVEFGAPAGFRSLICSNAVLESPTISRRIICEQRVCPSRLQEHGGLQATSVPVSDVS
jgi:hypothetical protein